MAAHVQQPAPDFSCQAVVNGTFQTTALADYKGKYLVLFFYPLDFTFVCPTEILAFNDRVNDFRRIGAEVVGASVDSEYTHLAWINTPRKEGGISGVTIPLLADLDKKIASDYGVLLPNGVALRGLFVIDPKGIVRHITVNDLPIGRSVDEALRVVQAVQFADEHGEVCPADWTPGKDAMKPDPTGSKEYFKKVG
jgi:peroxiredoxin (alkyl hydroperoxide reductase subunit C)